MTLALPDRDAALHRLAVNPTEAQESGEWLLDLLRAEVHARGEARRASCIERIHALLEPVVSIEAQRLSDCCETLVRAGDLVLAPGGVLHATPLRVMRVADTARLVGSMPTRPLAAALGTELLACGPTRSLPWSADLAAQVAGMGGCEVTPDTWAGLDRAPTADAAFLEGLNQRLAWEPSSAGLLDRDGPLEWRAWTATPRKPGSARVAETGLLWSAPRPYGGHYHAWTSGKSPVLEPFVQMRTEEAERARYALLRTEGVSPRVTREEGQGYVLLVIPGWLPRPEYRWLTLHARFERWGQGTSCWRAQTAETTTIIAMLEERLGLSVEAR